MPGFMPGIHVFFCGQEVRAHDTAQLAALRGVVRCRAGAVQRQRLMRSAEQRGRRCFAPPWNAAPRPGHETTAAKNLMLDRLTVFLTRPITLGISSQLEGALPGTLWNVGVGAAPAGVGVVPCALGRPWVTVRAHYGALPSVAGRGR
jgi:hypothetical protein